MNSKAEISLDLLDRILRLMGTTEGRRQIRTEVNAILAAPVVERQEPVYLVRYRDGYVGWRDVDRDTYDNLRKDANYESRILYAEQPAPVAVVLPERPDAIIEGVMTSVGITHAIYACTVTLKDREQVKMYRNRHALMVLPERKATIAFGEPDIRGEAWNACLDKVKELNQ